eukprot:scaffold3413_cov58-Phaeocystis_antarctica.AAC.2
MHAISLRGALAGSRIQRDPQPGDRPSRWTSGGPCASSRSSPGPRSSRRAAPAGLPPPAGHLARHPPRPPRPRLRSHWIPLSCGRRRRSHVRWRCPGAR